MKSARRQPLRDDLRKWATAAAGLINFVVLTAALSSCNSGIFQHRPHAGTTWRSKSRRCPCLPRWARTACPCWVLISVVMLLGGVLLNYLARRGIYLADGDFHLWRHLTWVIILLSQLKFRQTLSRSEVAAGLPDAVLSVWLVYCPLAFLVLVVGLMAYFPTPALPLLVGLGFAAADRAVLRTGLPSQAGELADSASGIASLKSPCSGKKPANAGFFIDAYRQARFYTRSIAAADCDTPTSG